MNKHKISLKRKISGVVVLTAVALALSVIAIRISESRTSVITSRLFPFIAVGMGMMLIRQYILLDKLAHKEQKLIQDIATAKKIVG